MNCTGLPRSARRGLLATLTLLIGSAGWIFAGHDPDVVHLCLKRGKTKIVNSAGQCRGGARAVALVAESALASLQTENAALQARIDELEMLAGRLHGHKAAVFAQGSSGSAPGSPGGYLIRLNFCTLNEFMALGDCTAANGTVLATALVTEADLHTAITFDASNAAGFETVAELLSNGENDVMKVETDYHDGNGNFAGGSSTLAPERAWFFTRTQTTSGIGFDDLEELEIESISLSVDFISTFFDANTQSTSHSIEYRIFFNIAP